MSHDFFFTAPKYKKNNNLKTPSCTKLCCEFIAHCVWQVILSYI